LFAAKRARGKSILWRLRYFMGSPLIPAVRLLRILSWARNSLSAESLHAIVIGLILDGLGQMVGYVAGTGEAVKKMARFEFHRSRHITERDRREVFLT